MRTLRQEFPARRATKIESWLALAIMAMSTSAFAWLGQQWSALAAQGWAAVLIFAIMAASLVAVALSISYLAIARIRYRPTDVAAEAPKSGIDESTHSFDPRWLYVGELGFGCRKLATDFFMEFWVKGFNATGSEISLFATTGAITYKVKGGEPDAGTLSPPAWLPDRGPTTGSFKDRSEFMFVLEQRVPGALAKAMIKEIESGEKFELGLNSLNLMVGPTNDSTRVRLPIWNSVYIGKID